MHIDSLYVGTVSHPGQPEEDWHFRPYSRQNVEAMQRDSFACLVIASRRDLTKLWTTTFSKWVSAKPVNKGQFASNLSAQVRYVSRRYGQRHFESGSRHLKDLLEEVDRGQLAAAVVADIGLPLDQSAIEAALGDLAVGASAQGDPGDPGSPLETRNREVLLQAQREMLNRVPCLSSEGLATKLQSTALNASQLGNDLRNSGKIFGVRYGRAWNYPQFQFEPAGRPFPEMRDVLSALTGDERGWDRLQWFLEPDGILNGRTPLEVWENGQRNRVVEAARRAKWQGRD